MNTISGDEFLQQSLLSAQLNVQGLLTEFALSERFLPGIETVFGDNFNRLSLEQFYKQWQDSNFANFPEVELRSLSELNGANGAFSVDTNKIYISREFLTGNDADAITNLLLEEYGHYVDTQINSSDTPGDEGAIFSALVRGEDLSNSQLQQLKNEDDSAVVIIDGESVAIEQNDSNLWIIELTGVELPLNQTIDLNGIEFTSNGQYGFIPGANINTPDGDLFTVYYDPAFIDWPTRIEDVSTAGNFEPYITSFSFQTNDFGPVIEYGGEFPAQQRIDGSIRKYYWDTITRTKTYFGQVNIESVSQNKLSITRDLGFTLRQEQTKLAPSADRKVDEYTYSTDPNSLRSYGDLPYDDTDTGTLFIENNVVSPTLYNVLEDLWYWESDRHFSPYQLSPRVDVLPVDPKVVDLVIAQTDSPDPVRVGEEFTYTLNVTNQGQQEATDVVLTDNLLQGVEFVSTNIEQANFTQNGNTLTYNLGTLAAGNGKKVTITVKPTIDSQPSGNPPPEQWTITNTASVTANETDSDISNNQVTEITEVTNLTCPDTGSLNIELESGIFEDIGGDGDCDGTGTVYIGHKDGIQRMLRIDNADVEINDENILIKDGEIYSLIGSDIIKNKLLFDIGLLSIATGTTSSNTLFEESDSNSTEEESDSNSTKEFKLAGLDIRFDSGSSLNINQNSFDLGGQFTLPESVGSHEVKLIGDELLRIENDKVRFTKGGKIDPKFDGEFNIFNAIGIKSAEPTLFYDDSKDESGNEKDELKLQGAYTLKQPFIKILSLVNQGNLEFTTGKNDFFKIKDGKADFAGSISFKNLKLPDKFELPELKLGLKTENEEIVEILGGMKVKFPPSGGINLGVGVEVGFRLDPLYLDSFKAELSGLNIPVPPPTGPTFISSINGFIEDIAPDKDDQPITFGGGLGLTFGPKQPFDTTFLTETILGIDIDAELALVNAKLEGKLSSENAQGKVKIKVIDDKILKGEGTLLWDWNKDFVEYKGETEALNGLLIGRSKFKFDEAKSTFTASGEVTINVPDNPLFFGFRGKALAGAFLQSLYSADGNDSNDYIAAWATIALPNPSASGTARSATFGAQYFFLDGSFKPIFSGKEIPITGSWDIEPGVEWLTLTAQWENATDEDIAVRVINEQGQFIEEADFAANNIAIVEDLSGSNTKTVIIDAPNTGVWDIEVVDNNALGAVEYIAYRDTAAPTIEITTPVTDVSGGEVTIGYEAFDADSDAQVQLFYDDDNEGFDGILITNDLTEQDGADIFLWNTEGVATGEYYIYGMVKDEENAPVFSYSSGKVQITDAADLSVTQTVDTESVDVGEEQTYTVTVTNNGEDNSQGVKLTYNLPEGTSFVSATITPSEQNDNNLVFDLGDLAKDDSTTLDITVSASNILDTNISSTFVSSNTYDPDRSNNTTSFATTVTNSQSLPELSINDVSPAEGNEGNTEFSFTVSLNEASTETITVDYATADGSAIASEDYTATNGTLEFAPNETEKSITVEVIGDSEVEEDETFLVNLSNASGGTIAKSRGIGTIKDDDSVTEAKGPIVYRFFNSTTGVHFYSADQNERDFVRENLDNYQYEGESYITVDSVTGNSPEEVYRFFNLTTGVHLYTTDKNERDYIIENLGNFAYEDVKFYAYETEVAGTVPIHRFYEPTIGVHFYTPNEAEKISVEENLSNYTYEGIAYYAFPVNDI